MNCRPDHSAAHLSSHSFSLWVGVWGHSTLLHYVQVRSLLSLLGSLRRWREWGGKRDFDHFWLSETLEFKATLIKKPLEKMIPFLGLWPWWQQQVLPPHSALSLGRGECWKAQSQVPVLYYLPNIFMGLFLADSCLWYHLAEVPWYIQEQAWNFWVSRLPKVSTRLYSLYSQRNILA